MKTPPRYIRNHADTFLMCMTLIKKGHFYSAMALAKSTRSHRLIQRLQRYSDETYVKRTARAKRNQVTREDKPYRV